MASLKCKELWCLIYSGLLFTSGLLLFGSCIYLGYKIVSSTHSFKFAPAECIGPFILLTLLGCTHCILAKLGVSGSMKKVINHIVWFKIGLVVQIVAEIAIGTWVIILHNKINLTSTNLIITSFQSLLRNNYDKSSWESLQKELQCCGVNNATDYTTNVSASGTILVSCCINESCLGMHPNGCKDFLVKHIKKLLLDLGLISFGSVAFLIIGVISFCYLHKAINESTERPKSGTDQETRRINK